MPDAELVHGEVHLGHAQPPHPPDPKVAVALLIEQEGRVLLQQRAMEPRKGLWTFPSGFMNRGEQAERVAEREAMEELGVPVRLTHLLGVYSEPGNPTVLIVYTAVLVQPELPFTLQADEVTAVGYYAPDRLPPLAFAHDSQIVADWLAFTREGQEIMPR